MKTQITLSLLLAGGASLGLLALPSPAVAGGGFTKVTSGTLKVDGTRYWRKKANEAKLGAVGQKMTPAVGANFFQHKQDAPNGIYEVHTSQPITITSKQANSWGVSGGASNVQGGASGSSSYKGKITAYKMKIDLGNARGDIRYETNRHTKHLQALKDEGNGGRMISAVWIMVNGKESKEGCYSGELTVSNGAWTVNTTASGCASSSYTIPPGSILAYEMSKVRQWDNEELTEKPKCPSGYSKYDTRSSPATPKDRCEKVSYVNTSVVCKLAVTDKAKNWYVSARSGKDVCKSKKGKPNKSVKCSKSGYSYVSQSGKDTCRKASSSFKDPYCPKYYVYDKNSTGNGGVDQCHLRGIADMKFDSNSGF